jgi:hypothetical protein
MKVNFRIMDEEEDLEHGKFGSFYGSEMDLTFADAKSRVTFNTTIHKTFLLDLLVKISSLYQQQTPFSIATFGNAMDYKFKLQSKKLIIVEEDKLANTTKEIATFDSHEFYKIFKKGINKYLNDVERINPKINQNEQFIFFKQQFDEKLS